MKLPKLVVLSIALAFCGVVAAGVPRASAQGDPWKAAQASFSRGETAYLSGKYDDATEAFKQAYASRPMPQFLYNIAAAFHLKGKKASDPDSYDIHRKGGHLSFGQGLHFCLGSSLARLVLSCSGAM